MSRPTRSPDLWESVAGGLWRLEVPGGWIYATEAPGAPGRTIAFVPAPSAAGLPAIAPLTPATAAEPRFPATRTLMR